MLGAIENRIGKHDQYREVPKKMESYDRPFFCLYWLGQARADRV